MSTMINYSPNMPIPGGPATSPYADGWKYADWYLSTGGSADADSPDGWSDEKYEDWWDRLAEEKRKGKGRVTQ